VLRIFSRRAEFSDCTVNDLSLRLPRDFVAMFGHCRTPGTNTYYIETEHFRRIRDHLPTGGTAVDIGASGGVFTAGLSLKAGPTGSVYAFEPARRAMGWLRKTVSANNLRNVIAEQVAVSYFDGSADFYELPATSECSWRPEASALELAHPATDAAKYSVAVVRLDTYFAAFHKKIDVIKIDIEGFEAHALRGGVETIKRHTPYMAIDIHARVGAVGDTEKDVRDALPPVYTFEREGHVLLCAPT
jgi:FkbM family methyltransferase